MNLRKGSEQADRILHVRRIFRNSLCLSIGLLLAAVTLVAAHADLIRSEPAANERLAQSPARVTLWFNEELDTAKSAVQIFDVDDAQVDRGDGHVDLNDPDHASMIVTLPALPEGVYVVRWRAVTIDDDGLTEGELDFLVGDAAPRVASAPPAASPALDWLPLVAAFAALGVGIVALVRRKKR
jgi:methionine-rich copper-binding protein CopC